MSGFSLPSALIGAVITAALAYIVQVVIARRGEKKRQQRLALLYLIRIGEIIALKRTIELVFRYEMDKAKKDLSEIDYLVHFIAVALSKKLDEGLNPSDYLPKSIIVNVIEHFKRRISRDFYLGYKIDDEFLASLPEDAIVQYHFFIPQVTGIADTLTSWISALETKDFSRFNPTILYNQLMGFKMLHDSAESLRNSLIIKSKISKKKSEKILKEQSTYYTSMFATVKQNEKIIEILTDSFSKSQDKEKQPK